MSGDRSGTESFTADKVARKGLSDRYPRKNQTFRQMPNSLPNPPTFSGGNVVRTASILCRDSVCAVSTRDIAGMQAAIQISRVRQNPPLTVRIPTPRDRGVAGKIGLTQPNNLTLFLDPSRMERLERPQR